MVLLAVILKAIMVVSQGPVFLEGPRVVTVTVDAPILNNDVLAARDGSQGKAFTMALEQALPQSMESSARSQRVQSAIRYIKSFQVKEEHRVGDTLKVTYEVEIQDSAFEAPPQSASAPAVDSPFVPLTEEVSLEIVFLVPFNAPEAIDQIETQLKIPVTSRRLTRSAILLKVKPIKSAEEMRQEIQAFIGSRGQVNLISSQPAPTLSP